MKRIAFLGVENSHANTFIGYIKNDPAYSDIEIAGVYSDEPEASEKLKEKYGVKILDSYDSEVGRVDGIVVTARHGDNHYKYAKPYIASGVPMFIDKPVTISEDEAVTFMKELRAAGVKVSGGSSLRHDRLVCELKKEAEADVDGKTTFGVVRAPVQMNSVYGGFFFYSQHLVETVTEIFGRYPEAVTAIRNGDNVTVTFEYPDYTVVGHFGEGSGVYYAARHTATAAHGDILARDGMNNWFSGEFKEYVAILRGESDGRDYTEFIAPVFILAAIDRSIKSGKREPVRRYSLD